jgi:hypothetical protein
MRTCTHCGAPARYVQAPTSIDEALRSRERLCERCYKQHTGSEEVSPLDDPGVWNPPEGGDESSAPEPIPAVYVSPPEPDLPDLPQPDDLPGLDDAGVAGWVDRLCAAEAVRSPGTRYAEGTSPAALRAELRADLGTPSVQQAWDRYRAARRQGWEREAQTPRYEGEHRAPALRAEALRMASDGYDAEAIYLGLLQFNHDCLIPPHYEDPRGPDGEVRELRELAEEIYQNLPLSALRVEERPQVIDANIGGGKIIRNDLRARKMYLLIQMTDKEGNTREPTPNTILNVALDRVAVRVSPRAGVTRYEFEFIGWPRTTIQVTGTLPEVAGRLVEEGVVILPHLLQPALAAVIQLMRERQYCRQTDAEPTPGFYPAKYRDRERFLIDLGDGIQIVDARTSALNRAALREGLELLDWIVREYASYAPRTAARLSLAIRWHLVAPFAFIRKHFRITQDILVLQGSSQTGKSVSGQIGLAIWGRNDPTNRVTNGAFNTEARAGETLASGTYPVVVDEADLQNEAIHTILKNAWESIFSRTPLTTTRQKVMREAFALPCLTSNQSAPVADALRNRCAILHYDLRDREWTARHEGEFKDRVLPRLEELSQIGSYITAVVQRSPALLVERDWVTLGTATLTHAYQYAGLPVPHWVSLEYVYRRDTATEARVTVALAIRDLITRTFAQEFPKYRALFSDRADRSWEGQFWSLAQKLNLLLAAGSIGCLHPVRKSGVRRGTLEAEIQRADDVIEGVRIDGGVFAVPEFKDSQEVRDNLHEDLENLARLFGVEKPEVQNVQGPGGGRTKRVAVTVPTAVILTVIESATGGSEDL